MSKRQKKELSVPERHQLTIAKSTMRMHCVGALIMGGMNHKTAVGVIKKLTGKIVSLDSDCTCQ